MDLVQYGYDALKDLNLPILHLTRPKELPGATYHFFNVKPSLHGDGQEKRAECNCQVDIWSRDGKIQNICKDIRTAMKRAGFLWVSEDDNFEPDAAVYHKIIIFYFEYETEE